MPRVRLTNDSLNSYGTRILTSGMDVSQYQRNPVLLYMHSRGSVIGLVRDIKVADNEVTGELAFDEATELSRQAKAQFEFGSLRMVSVGIDIVELSEDRQLLLPGQTAPTVSKSRLREVSLVDIGANDDAIVLSWKGADVTLAEGGANPLPRINPKKTDMEEIKELALLLGLPETATFEAVKAKIAELASLPEQLQAARQEAEGLRLDQITTAVDGSIREHRLSAEKRDDFIKLGQAAGVEMLHKALDAISPAVKPMDLIAPSTKIGYTRLSEVPTDELEAMRENDPSTYKKLYSAEYGIECEI